MKLLRSLLAVAVLALTGCASLAKPGPDKNFFSISGDDQGNIWVNDVPTYTADQPGMRELHVSDFAVPEGGGYNDALKISGIRRLKVVIGQLDARFASEDAIDINHSQDVEVIVGQLWPGHTYAGTIKGASQRIRISVAQQHGHGRETDWDFGNFSDQGNGYTRECRLSIDTADRSPVKVRVLSADRPAIENPAQRYDFAADDLISALFYPVFNFAKDLVASIPAGSKP